MAACERLILGTSRDFLVGARERITRVGIPKPPEVLEARKRITHGKDLVTRLARLVLRFDEGQQRAEVIAEARNLGGAADDPVGPRLVLAWPKI